MTLEFAIWDHFERQHGVPLSRQYAERIALVQQAEEYGFAAYHLAEHHLTPLDMAPSPSVFLSAVAQQTSRIRFGPMVYCLPLYHPVRLLQEICMLDHLSGGRFEPGVGRGIRDIEHEWFGIRPEDSRARYTETLEVLRQGLRTGRLNYHGSFFDFEDVDLLWQPLQRPLPPIWYAGTIASAADQGLNGFGRPAPAEVYDDYWRRWREHRAAGSPLHEREPKVGSMRHLVVADSDDAARAIARRAWSVYQDHFFATDVRVQGRRMPRPDGMDTANPRSEASHVLAGSPETVRTALQQFLRDAGSGHTYLACAVQWGDMSHAEAMHSLRLYATEVVPALAGRQVVLAS